MSHPAVERQTFFVDNGAGWRLALHRYRAPAALRRDTRPMVLVPGYAMNSFILGFHPTGRSIAEYLAARGREVWCVDLRGQGEAHRVSGRRRFGLFDVGLVDLAAAIEGVRERSEVDATHVDAVGCSLGATYVFMQAAWRPDTPIARLVNIGGPMRWASINPLIRLAMGNPKLLGRLPIRGTRQLARHALPLLAKVPGLLHVYLHPAICDLSQADQLVRTVDDPVPQINQEIAHWIGSKDLLHDGRNLTLDLARVMSPLLTIVANADGICPQRTVLTGHDHIGSRVKATIIAGDKSHKMAHADLFISELAEREVFAPMADWLDATDGE